MITNRNVLSNRGGLGDSESRLSCWVSGSTGSLERFAAWDRRSPSRFRDELCEVAETFPFVEDLTHHERERHITLFIHGYNTTW